MAVGYLAHSFDLINVRDLDVIAQAARLCSSLVVGVLSDELVERQYGRPPVVPAVERLALVARVRGVATVLEHTGAPLPRELSEAQIFVVGGEPAVHGLAGTALAAARESASEVLRTALRPVNEASEAVA